MKGLPRMLKLLTHYPQRLRWFIMVSILYALAAMSFTFIFKTIMDLLAEDSPPAWIQKIFPAINEHRAFFAVLGLTMVLLFFKCLFQYLRRYLQGWLTQKVVLDAQRQLVSHLLTLDMPYFQQERAGELLSRMTNDLSLLGNSVKLACVLLTRPLTLAAFLIAIFVLDWRLALLGLIGAPLAGCTIRILSRKMRQAAKLSQEKRADLTSVMVQFLTGIRTVKAFACEEFEREQFARENQQLFAVNMRHERARAKTRPLMEFVSFFGAIAVMAVGGEWVMNNKLSLGDLVAFLGALGMMYQPAKELSTANNQLQASLPGAERVFQIMDLVPQIKEGTQELGEFRDAIRFQNVHFAYVQGNPVLHGINLEITKGECVALVGRTGVGKSTLTDLLLRFFDPAQGEITIDGVNLRTLTFASLRANLALVSQDPFLFNCSIRDNIAYGHAELPLEQIERAARAANIHDEILAMPQGYDTVVGERGENLSGGQRQRVAIARALFKDSPILILDEATSSLDSESELKVQAALAQLMAGRTSLVIAHRLSTIRHADRIVVLEDGRITAQGKHEELLHSSPVYAHLVKLQGGGAC